MYHPKRAKASISNVIAYAISRVLHNGTNYTVYRFSAIFFLETLSLNVNDTEEKQDQTRIG